MDLYLSFQTDIFAARTISLRRCRFFICDENCDIRWLASEGLVALGEKALVPLLETLEHRSSSAWFREGAHHVLFKLARGDLALALLPVLVAMEDVEPAVEVPPAAYAALVALRRKAARAVC